LNLNVLERVNVMSFDSARVHTYNLQATTSRVKHEHPFFLTPTYPFPFPIHPLLFDAFPLLLRPQ
jgi:hypothetical protein